VSQEINRPGLMEVLRRTLGMSGAKSPAGILTPELQGSLVVENDRPEFSVLGGEYRFTGFNEFTIVDDEGQAFILNPANSNVLAVIEHIKMSVRGAASASTQTCFTVGMLLDTVPSTSGGSFTFPTDTRVLAGATPQTTPILLRNDPAGVAVPTYDFWHHDAATTDSPNCELVPDKEPFILRPGVCLIVNIDNTGHDDADVEWAVAGRCRALIPSELNRLVVR